MVGVLSIHVLTNGNKTVNNMTSDDEHYKETCMKLNKEKSIVDSGTTNIRLPDIVFREVIFFYNNKYTR